MSDQPFSEDNEATQMMSAPPPLANTAPPAQAQSPTFAGAGPSGGNSGGASGRAIAALVLAIASFLCCGFFTGIPAIIVGRIEEGAIKRGEAPESGRMLAKVGWILGLISTLLNCLFMAILGIYLLLVGGTIGSGVLDILHQAKQQDTHFAP
ncbi:MAG: DUF4190 domain-containing protein [Deltaproteobacteria bacterium]|nr:DUF4190 domain-containing protein [Deltaproteobacteria bacterium]